MTARNLGISLILLLLGATACQLPSSERAKTEEFARLFVELRLASRTFETEPERALRARQDILKHAGLDLNGYRAQLRNIQSDPKLWTPFWERTQKISDSLDQAQHKGK